jgi:hypothetical protein
MADFFTHNAPDFGEEDGVMGPPGTSIADRLRRAALLMTMTTQRVWQDPLHTLFPSIGPTGGAGGHRVGFGMSSAKNDQVSESPVWCCTLDRLPCGSCRGIRRGIKTARRPEVPLDDRDKKTPNIQLLSACQAACQTRQ